MVGTWCMAGIAALYILDSRVMLPSLLSRCLPPTLLCPPPAGEMRQAYLEKAESQKMKQKARERMQPKMGKLDIDYQVGGTSLRAGKRLLKLGAAICKGMRTCDLPLCLFRKHTWHAAQKRFIACCHFACQRRRRWLPLLPSAVGSTPCMGAFPPSRCCTTPFSSTRPSPSLQGPARCTTRARSLRPPSRTHGQVGMGADCRAPVHGKGGGQVLVCMQSLHMALKISGPLVCQHTLTCSPFLPLALDPTCRRVEPRAAKRPGHDRGRTATLAGQHAGAMGGLQVEQQYQYLGLASMPIHICWPV